MARTQYVTDQAKSCWQVSLRIVGEPARPNQIHSTLTRSSQPYLFEPILTSSNQLGSLRNKANHLVAIRIYSTSLESVLTSLDQIWQLYPNIIWCCYLFCCIPTCSHQYQSILAIFTHFYSTLLNSTHVYPILLNSTEFYPSLRNSIQCHSILPIATQFYSIPPNPTQSPSTLTSPKRFATIRSMSNQPEANLIKPSQF